MLMSVCKRGSNISIMIVGGLLWDFKEIVRYPSEDAVGGIFRDIVKMHSRLKSVRLIN